MSAQGMAETVAWTALHNAMVQDGLSPPVQPGPQVTKAIRELVSEAPTARPPVGVKPEFYLTKADAHHVKSKASFFSQVVALREPASKDAVPFYTAPPAPIDVTDPWRGLYRPEHLRANGDGGVCHPDLPSWPDDREDALDKLIHAQGFDFKIIAGDFSDEGIEDGDERYWQEIRAWTPEAPDGDWRLAWKGDTEDGPYAWFVRPMALRPEPDAGSGWDALETALEIFKRRKSDIPYAVYEQIEVICSLIAARQPVPMVLHCPRCHLQHIDAPDERTPEWHNPPHRSHLCHGCGFVWRPADVPTVGVERTQTTGKNDSPPAPQQAQETI